jgi:DNA uptake protein ComE-like DNA-binding protein
MNKFIVLPLFAALTVALHAASAPSVTAWETWDNCRLESGQYFDGDSFHVKHGRTSAIIRLYFVDAPETDASLGERLAEQAAYFRAKPAAVLRAGEAAKQLTALFLDQPFRVITRWQIAPGASQNQRYYGIVKRGGRRLDAALVEAGLARVSGESAEYPDTAAAQRTVLDLRKLEIKAADAGRGAWVRPTTVESLKNLFQARKTARRINLNTATSAEIESLPGIGPKLAEQIIRARPIKDLAALDAIRGIGPKKIEALRELVSF